MELLAFESSKLDPSLFRICSEKLITTFEFVAISIDPFSGPLTAKTVETGLKVAESDLLTLETNTKRIED